MEKSFLAFRPYWLYFGDPNLNQSHFFFFAPSLPWVCYRMFRQVFKPQIISSQSKLYWEGNNFQRLGLTCCYCMRSVHKSTPGAARWAHSSAEQQTELDRMELGNGLSPKEAMVLTVTSGDQPLLDESMHRSPWPNLTGCIWVTPARIVCKDKSSEVPLRTCFLTDHVSQLAESQWMRCHRWHH